MVTLPPLKMMMIMMYPTAASPAVTLAKK
jgi:hypothetical protein